LFFPKVRRAGLLNLTCPVVYQRSFKFADTLLGVLARLRPDVSLEQAWSNLGAIRENIARTYPKLDNKVGFGVMPFQEFLVRNSRPNLYMFLGAVAFVLLISCANVANLLLARAARRQKEIAIRLSLGAPRGRLIRQLLVESVLLALLGGGLGLLMAVWGKDFLVDLLSARMTRVQEASIDLRVLGFTFFISLLSGIIFGLAPAILGSKTDLNEALKDGQGQGVSGRRRHYTRSLLVISEVALTFVLLVGAGLLLRSLGQLHQIDPGFQTENVLTLRVTLPKSKYAAGPPVGEFFRQVIDRVKVVPGAEIVGLVDLLPLGGQDTKGILTIEDSSPAGPRVPVSLRNVNHDYFNSIKLPLLRGRNFTAYDDQSAPRVVIINAALAQLLWPGENALGKHVRVGGPDSPLAEIVGVVGDIKHWSLITPQRPEIYSPFSQNPKRSAYLTVRSAQPNNLTAAVRQAVMTVDQNQPVYNVKTLEQRLNESISFWRLPTFLFGFFAALALLLAAIGIYGLMSYTVTQSTREIGIRMALGAQANNVLKLVIGQALMLALTGIVIGLAGAWGLTRLMTHLLYEVKATDFLTFAGVSLLLIGVAVLACYLPARRATKVDPLVALRCE
jgi:predicted permease